MHVRAAILAGVALAVLVPLARADAPRVAGPAIVLTVDAEVDVSPIDMLVEWSVDTTGCKLSGDPRTLPRFYVTGLNGLRSPVPSGRFDPAVPVHLTWQLPNPRLPKSRPFETHTVTATLFCHPLGGGPEIRVAESKDAVLLSLYLA